MGAERKIAAVATARTESQVTSRTPHSERAPASSSDDARIGTVFGGQYRIDAELGGGGMGAVYRGRQLSIDRGVAIKLIAPDVEQSASHVQRFRREADALARLRHPNTVHLLDFGVTDEGRLFMVMELLSGRDLECQLAQDGPLQLAPALRIVRQIARSLSEAHALGIVHRDLKPSNVFLSRVEGGDTFVKVTDFGVAGFAHDHVGSTLTLEGTVIGTAAYMPPEQAQGAAVDARSDLYSLGVVLFEMLTGRPPFQANSAVSLLIAHVSEQPPRLAGVCPELPALEHAQALLDLLLAKDPAERLGSAAELISQIDAILLELGESALPISEAPPAPRKRARRKNRWLFGITLLALAATGFVWHERPEEFAALRAGAAPQLALWQQRGQQLARDLPAQLQSTLARWRTPARITIASVPSGAVVRLAGAELGKTPYELALRDSTMVELELPGHAAKTIAVDPAGEPNLVVKLTPLPPYQSN